MRKGLFYVIALLYANSLFAQAPADISMHLELWFKADIGVNEGSVGSWADQSPNNCNIIQPTTAQQPLRQSMQMNYNPVIEFDGNSDFLPITALNYDASTSLSSLATFVVF